MKNDQNLSRPAAAFYALAPLAVYIVISSVVGGCMQVFWTLYLQDRAVEAGGPDYAYAVFSVWYILCTVVPVGLGCLAIQRDLREETAAFARRFVREGGEGRESVSAGALAVLLTGSAALSLGINILISCLGVTAALPVSIPGAAGMLIESAVYGIFMPFAEELLFRGLLYARLRRMLGAVRAAALSAAVFGFYHASPAQGLYAFLMGLVFAAAYEKTGRIAVPWGLHGVCNLMVLLLYWTDTYRLLCTPAWALAFLGISAGAFVTLRRIRSTGTKR